MYDDVTPYVISCSFFAEVESSGISQEFSSLLESADEMDGVSDVVLKV